MARKTATSKAESTRAGLTSKKETPKAKATGRGAGDKARLRSDGPAPQTKRSRAQLPGETRTAGKGRAAAKKRGR